MASKKASFAWAALAIATVVGTVTHRYLRARDPLTAGRVAETLIQEPKAVSANLEQRVDDPHSEAFDRWLGAVHEANLEADKVLDLLDSNLSDAQKNSLLEDYLKSAAGLDSIAASSRWQSRLSSQVFSSQFDFSLGSKAGRILAKVSSNAQLETLEAEYKRSGPALKVGNKLAVVTASRNPEFISHVLNDTDEPLDVRERALERLADVGNVGQLRSLTAADSKADPVLKNAALAKLAASADDVDGLKDVVELSKSQPEQDSLGRSALNVAQVGASESSVDGKSSVLFAEWQQALVATQAGVPTEGVLVQALVTGKALSRAVWTEANELTAARLIDGQLSPLVTAILTLPNTTDKSPTLQALLEFASDFYGECAMRAPEACASASDRRISYRVELAASLRPRLAGTDYAFYLPQLGG